MNKKLIATVGAAAFALTMSASVSHATMIAQPGETMGVALGAPLPEGVFAVDLEDYGRRDSAGGPGNFRDLGVNVPLIAWSTPWTLMDSRIEVLYAAPFTHLDSSSAGGLNRLDYYSQLLAVNIAHDFGNGFFAGLLLGIRSPDSFLHVDYVAADIRPSFGYTANGYNFVATFYYNGAFGSKTGNTGLDNGRSDAVAVDLTATKKFDKLELGFVGNASTDVNDRSDNLYANGVNIREGHVALGGLIGYDFGRFTVQGMVTRDVAARGKAIALNGSTSEKETRGWLRIIVPLWVAPKAAPAVVARY
ncbi:transporter [Beijerinckia sp. L45]|uniref:transporter n=1 Tax=Beijerinckia sp. L45 TaxID=1641855 RepID=UPI00131E5DA1|nr:transporter [Beijerinckia sp. L45]